MAKVRDREPNRPAHRDRHDRDQHAGKADHGADRQIEFTGDHQKTCADGDDHELGRDGRPVENALRGEHAAVEGEKKKERENRDGADNAAQFRTDQSLAERGTSP
jgi:hypothetical protein